MKDGHKTERLTVGWKTTDEEEIALRKKRGADEPMRISAVAVADGFHGDYEVVSKTSGQRYTVEIRSLDKQENSCTCTDFRHNNLGTCKHIESVMLHLRHRRKRAFAEASANGSPMVEIFLKRDKKAPHVCIQWPQQKVAPQIKRDLGAFFDEQGRLRGEPLQAIPELQCAAERFGKAVRISDDVSAWAQRLRRELDRKNARKAFLDDVQSGRNSMNILKARLYPYQQEGMLHLAFGERALLADEMGLGKTIQAIAACELLRRIRGARRVLVVAPASLKTEWEEQIKRFTDQSLQVVYGLRGDRLKQYRNNSFFTVCNYEQVRSDVQEINTIMAPDIVVLDEAQRIKNWAAKTARQIKRLKAPYAFVLTGTPLENRIDEVYSIVEFLDPGIFGPLFRFNREFYQLNERGRPVAAHNLGELHRRLKSVMLRRRKDEVEEQLPERTIRHFYVQMATEQQKRHDEYLELVAKLAFIAKRRPLTREEWKKLQKFLACMRMLCDTPYILDPECRISPKLGELKMLLEPILAGEESKIIIFSEWEMMLELVRDELEAMGVAYAWHTGSVPQKARRVEINRFKDDPACRIFLSTDSGATGLNLQCASVVVNLDLPWNPARLEQRIARAWRKHQKNKVRVFNLVAENSIESKMIEKLELKRRLADGAIDGMEGVDAVATGGSQRAMLERLTAMLDVHLVAERTDAPSVKPAAPEPDPVKTFSEELVAAHKGKVRQITRHCSAAAGSLPTVLAVVRDMDERSRSSAAATLKREAANVEVIDEATLATIKRLVEAGVLQFTGPAPEVLFNNDDTAESEADETAQRYETARPLLDDAQRQLKMARLLCGNDFVQEAVPPLKAAAAAALKGAWIMALGDGEEIEPGDKLVMDVLLQQAYASAGALAALMNLRKVEALDEPDTQTACDAIEQLIDGIRNSVEE